MPTIRDQLPYAHLLDRKNDSPEMRKISVMVSVDDKRTITAALAGDDAIYSFIVQHAFQQTAEFIRINNLNVYNTHAHQRILNFIRNRTDTRPAGDPVALDDAGSVKTSQPTPPATSSVSSAPREGSPGRSETEPKARKRKVSTSSGR
jgi:hypothetical protein